MNIKILLRIEIPFYVIDSLNGMDLSSALFSRENSQGLIRSYRLKHISCYLFDIYYVCCVYEKVINYDV